MNISGNSRYKETEKKIQEAFLSLLESKHVNAISIHAICSYAHISRPTFYAHYEDINDLILKTEQHHSTHIAALLASQNILTQTDFTSYVSYIKEHKNFYIAYFSYEGNANISQSIMDAYLASSQLQSSPAITYQMLFFMGGLKTVLYDWLIRNCPETIEEISKILLTQYQLLWLPNILCI